FIGSQRVFPNYNVMGVAKAALESSVRYLAADLGPKNIRVNAVSAGPIKTLAAAGISGFSSILQVYRDRAPMRRNMELKEVADAAMFLISPASRAVTGEVMMSTPGSTSRVECSPGQVTILPDGSAIVGVPCPRGASGLRPPARRGRRRTPA